MGFIKSFKLPKKFFPVAVQEVVKKTKVQFEVYHPCSVKETQKARATELPVLTSWFAGKEPPMIQSSSGF